jgi:hypothetical protein
MLDEVDLELLRESERTHALVHVKVTGCAYSCCGKPWVRRDGYEQDYIGYVNNLDESKPTPEALTTFLLVSPGLGTVAYWCALRESEIIDVAPQGAPVG